MIVSGMEHKNKKDMAVAPISFRLSMSPLPVNCETRMDTPVPSPRNTHSRISTGWLLVPTAASDTEPQKLPITSVSTVPYSCCSTFPTQMGSANNSTRFMMDP